MSTARTRVNHTVTSGTFSLDGETHEVDNNVWVVGDDHECVVIDAPHDVDRILAVVGGAASRRYSARTHTTTTCGSLPNCGMRRRRPSFFTPTTGRCGKLTHPTELWDIDLADGQVIVVGDVTLVAMHTPGHAPGAVCFYAEDLGCVFTGDTLFQGGAGATGRSFSDHDTIVSSIRERLFLLPESTVVHTGHGGDTTIAGERALDTTPTKP